MKFLRSKVVFLKCAAIVLSCLLFANPSFSKSYESSFIVAQVNDKVITNLELQDRYKFVLFSSEVNSVSTQEKRALLNQIIDKMVDEELIRQQAEKLQITTTQSEIRDAVEMVALRQKKNAPQYKIELTRRKISFENYAKQVDSELLWSKIISQILRSRVKITEAEVKEFFEEQKFNINVRKLFISQIFIPNDQDHSKNAAKLAKKLVVELRKGADFNNFVKQFSRDVSSVESNGEIGWVSQRDIDQRIYKGISKLRKGQYSNPVILSDGYYIFKLLDSKVETTIEDEDLEVARQNIYMKKLQNISKGYLMDMRKDAFIEVDRKSLLVRK